MAAIKKNYLVQKRNVLNELRANNMTLQELRFFSIYLSKIHKDKPNETRVVRFPLDDFRAIMELGRIDINYMKSVTNNLLCKVVNVPLESGGYTAFQLFKECTVSADENNEWYVEIDAHDKALPLMFEFKSKYFSYRLWNALRLRSTNQLRMYEILKQYENIGWRILSVEDLKGLLGIEKNEYPRFGDFKNYVLDACQQALAEHTDIRFTYEPYGKKGGGGKILSLKFIIVKNEDHTDPLLLDAFIGQSGQEANDGGDCDGLSDVYRERIELFMDACNGEFSFDEVVALNNKMRDAMTYAQFSDSLYCYHYINDRYQEMRRQSKNRKITNRFGYVKSIMDKEI